MKRLVFLILCLPMYCHGETYQGIEFSASLREVRSAFPKATIVKVNPAWASETESMYEMSGIGISGRIVIFFKDDRPAQRKMLEKDPGNVSLRRNSSLSNDDALRVTTVRWIPPTPILLSRLVLKYGQPSESGVSSVDMTPYRFWKKNGVTALLVDDETHVRFVEYVFGEVDCIRAAGKQKLDLRTSELICSALAEPNGK